MKNKKNKKQKNKQSGRFMKFCVGAIIIQAIVYTWVHLFLSYKVGMEISPTASCAFYAFCVGEGGACAYLKSMKTKYNKANELNENEIDENNIDENNLSGLECNAINDDLANDELVSNNNDNLGGM